MTKKQEIEPTHCLNCGNSIRGNYCNGCGQSVRDNSDRSLGPLLGDLFGNIFFIDNRFFLSIWYLFRFPSRMTVEFLSGKRKKFISPITLFLFFNLVYFFVSPLSDYSLSLEDQFYSQPYSEWIQESVINKIENDGLEGNTYATRYQQMSDRISKSILILNVPIIALLVYFMGFKRRRFYFDSIIFTIHFFSVFIFSLVLMKWFDWLIECLPYNARAVIPDISVELFIYIIPFLYAFLGMKKFLNTKWYWAIPAGFGVLVSVLFANLIYRFIIFKLTFWVT